MAFAAVAWSSCRSFRWIKVLALGALDLQSFAGRSDAMTAKIVAALTLSGLVLQVGAACSEEQMSYGETEYRASCAPCHGLQGKGDGPLASVLTKRPANLTVLAERNGGEFPYFKVFAVIDGRYVVPGHGDREMPIWGRQFLEQDTKMYGPKGGEMLAQERIHKLTEYVSSLQR
jgi:mono/diheme cytochrome c family protein